MALSQTVINRLIFVTMWLATLVLCGILNHGLGEVMVPWWSNAVYYRILVDSFKDSDGDGLGDLEGIIKQLSYVRAIGAEAVIVSPLLAKSKDCSKPGVMDFTAIDDRYGDLGSFSNLLEKAKKLEIKVIVTLPLQTISAGSEWFASSADRIAGFEDRVIWVDGTVEAPPSDVDGISWMWHKPRAAYWGAINNEVILNLCSEGVAAALSSAQCAWLRRGVHGFLLNPDFHRDQKCGENLLRKLTADAISCARGANSDFPVILVESALKPEIAAKYYGDGGLGANSILSRALTPAHRLSAAELGMAFHAAMLTAPQDVTPTWQTSATNESRTASRYGSDLVDAVNLLALILPGAAVIQQGDELGAADTILEWATTFSCWPTHANPSASPFPWDDSPNGGFTAGEPWLPLSSNYRYANAKTEFANDFSHVGVMRVAAAMRKSPAIGPHIEIKRLNGALAILRWGGSGSLLVVSNVARVQSEAQISKIPGLPAEMTVAASSGGSSLSRGSHLSIEKSLKLVPGETVLLAGGPRHCGGPGPVDKIASKLSEGWQKINKYFSNI